MLGLTLTACGGDDGEPTASQLLTKLAGEQLTEAQIEEQLALADMLCGFDSRLLTEIWTRLDARQLEFQDFVFGQRCPDRIATYEEVRPDTGYVPEELLRATTPTTTTRRTTSTPATVDFATVLEAVEPAAAGEAGDQADQ